MVESPDSTGAESRAIMSAPEILATGPLVLFDGVCNLCSFSVRFLAPRDRTGRLRFAAIQSEPGQEVLRHHGLPPQDWESFVFLDEGRVYLKSAAIFRIARFLRWPWPLVQLFAWVPRALTDWLYDRIARNRYALFGRKEHCLVPTAALRAKFLG
jgi:predicted DCC family thiol-disulfide oxidoreductase YuxK